MAAPRRTSTAKRERVIPVKVTVDPRPAPTDLPPIAIPPTVAPKPPVTPLVKAVTKVTTPVRALRQPVHEWSEEKRRRLMWWLVGGGLSVIIIGWAALVRYEFDSGPNQPNLFSDVGRLLRTIRLTSDKPQPNAAEQEIDKLDEQVFPQFQQ